MRSPDGKILAEFENEEQLAKFKEITNRLKVLHDIVVHRLLEDSSLLKENKNLQTLLSNQK